jgi:protein-tyrosine phosphatase
MAAGTPLSLAHSYYLLVELPRWLSGGIGTLDKLLYSLQLAGYMPILAHPERIVDFEANETQLMRWVRTGSDLSTSQRHIAGRDHSTGHTNSKKRYQRRRIIVDRLIRNGLVHVVASDAPPRRWHRPPLQQQHGNH